jgi:hypothetical protein
VFPRTLNFRPSCDTVPKAYESSTTQIYTSTVHSFTHWYTLDVFQNSKTLTILTLHWMYLFLSCLLITPYEDNFHQYLSYFILQCDTCSWTNCLYKEWYSDGNHKTFSTAFDCEYEHYRVLFTDGMTRIWSPKRRIFFWEHTVLTS